MIVTCILTHMWITLDIRSYALLDHFKNDVNIGASSIGLLLLTFPLLGYLADVHFTRYKAIKMSLLVQTACLLICIALTAIVALDLHQSVSKAVLILNVITFWSYMLTHGLYEANAVQFGLDQLLGASSSRLSHFIHWYFWGQHIGQLALFY